MDFVRSHFFPNKPLTSRSLFHHFGVPGVLEVPQSDKKVFNWSEVHSERSDFLQNPYFNWNLMSMLDPNFLNINSSQGYRLDWNDYEMQIRSLNWILNILVTLLFSLRAAASNLISPWFLFCHYKKIQLTFS